MSDKLQDKLDMVDIMDTLVQMPVETNEENVKSEIDMKDLNHTNENVESGSSKSRELKLLLALSKEANLDTNIVYKRKSTESYKLDKPDLGIKPPNNTEVDTQNQTRHIIRVDYNKHDVDTSEIPETKEDLSDKISVNLEEDVNNASFSAENVPVDTNEKHNTSILNNTVVIINDKRKDPFCWRCHHGNPTFYCETCPRSFHQKCLKNNVAQPERWICPVCVSILKAENIKQRSPAMRELSLEHFRGLLKFALKRMMQVEGHEPFINPVNEVDFPDYKKYVAQPQDLTSLEKNIKSNVYGCPQAFEADAQWILHNSIIFNSNQSKFTSIAKSMMKICKHEMSEIENCASCYLNANTKKKTWFVEVCPKPHMVVWAKLKGFPYWPAKAMRTNSFGMVDVRFFGAHDRAWVPFKDCFLYSLQDPNSNKQKRNDINESIKELNIYIENLKRIYGEFHYAPYRIVLDPEQELKQLRIMLPKYDPEKKVKLGRGLRKSLYRNGNSSPDIESLEKASDESFLKTDEDIEDTESYLQSDGSNCDSISDESSIVNNVPGRGANVRMRGGLVRTTGRIKVLPKTSPARKRLSCEDLDDLPPKLVRHDSEENTNPSDSETSEVNSDTKGTDNFPPIETAECSSLTDKTLVEENTISVVQENMQVTESLPKSIADLFNKKLSGLFDEEPQKESIVKETDSLLDTINNKIESIVEKVSEPEININSIGEINKNTLSQTSTKPTENVGIVEVIEVNVTGSPEPVEEMNLDVPINIEDIVEATDSSTVSISVMEPAPDPVSTNPDPPLEEEITQHISSVESLEQNLNSCSSTDEYTNPLDFVEVTESIPIEDKDANEELPGSERVEDILEVSTATISKLQQSNKRRRSNSDSSEEAVKNRNVPQKKSLRLVNIDDIRNKVLDNINLPANSISNSVSLIAVQNNLNSSTEPIKSLQSLLEKQLLTSANSNEDDLATVIKSEPTSEDEQNNPEVREQKLRYLYALNISEKLPQPPKKPVSMRTRSKSEENKVRLVNNMSRNTEEFSPYINIVHSNQEVTAKHTPPKRKELFVKPLSKMQVPKQKARKSFPRPIRNMYPGHKKDIVRVGKPIAPANTVRTPSNIKPNEILTSSSNFVYIAHTPTASTAVTLLPPNQPITYSSNRGNPILTMVQNPSNYLSLTSQPNKVTSERFESQNYIPLCGEVPKPRNTSFSRINLTTFSETVVTTAAPQVATSVTTPSTTNTVLGSTNATTDVLDGLGTLSSLIPDTLNKTISDMMCRAPPKLKRRPPGPLSTHFDEGLPSSIGTVTSRVNSISHRLGDYFRGMLIELLHEMSTNENSEAEITKLKLENEELRHKHNEEIIEIKKNVSTILKDVQKSIEDERTRIIEETRSACEAECVKRVEEAKSKQWCANCAKEAQFYCCWNTSYCDFPCQEKHWPKHMSKCTQNIQNTRPLNTGTGTIATNNTTSRPTQPLVLRQTAPPKSFSTGKTVIAKPTKVIVNRATGAKNSISYVRTTSGSHITLVESTPGNYELVGNGGPISVGGKFITGLGKIRNNVISVPPSPVAPSTSSGIPGNTQKSVLVSQGKSLQPTTTIISSDDDE